MASGREGSREGRVQEGQRVPLTEVGLTQSPPQLHHSRERDKGLRGPGRQKGQTEGDMSGGWGEVKVEKRLDFRSRMNKLWSELFLRSIRICPLRPMVTDTFEATSLGLREKQRLAEGQGHEGPRHFVVDCPVGLLVQGGLPCSAQGLGRGVRSPLGRGPCLLMGVWILGEVPLG